MATRFLNALFACGGEQGKLQSAAKSGYKHLLETRCGSPRLISYSITFEALLFLCLEQYFKKFQLSRALPFWGTKRRIWSRQQAHKLKTWCIFMSFYFEITSVSKNPPIWPIQPHHLQPAKSKPARIFCESVFNKAIIHLFGNLLQVSSCCLWRLYLIGFCGMGFFWLQTRQWFPDVNNIQYRKKSSKPSTGIKIYI